MLKLSNIEKSFNIGTASETKLFDRFSLCVKKGEFLSVVGSNGSGKTTMLGIISGRVGIEGGKIELCGRDVTNMPEYKRARNIGRVFQDPSLGTVASMTVAENIILAKLKGKRLRLAPTVSKRAKGEAGELVATLGLGLEDKLDLPVGLLSGGQRQALSLLISTVTPIDLLLLDEHTAALDPKTADTVMELTDRIVRDGQITAIMVTHNLRYAADYGNRMIMMHSGDTVLDVSGEEKAKTTVDDLLGLFNSISVECGN